MPVPIGLADESSAPVVLRICPPEQPLVSAFVQVPPFPVTVRLPVEPVMSSTIPFTAGVAGAPAEMLRKVSPVAPIVVLTTLSAVPLVVLSVLAAPVTVTVPPPVAAKAAFAPVDNVSVLVKEIVEPVLLDNEPRAPPVAFSVPP